MKYFIGIVFGFLTASFFCLSDESKLINSGDQRLTFVAPHLIEAARRLKQNSAQNNPRYFCLICEQVIDGVISLRRSNTTREVMMDYLNQLCYLYTDWGTEACKGTVDIQTDTILYIIDSKLDLRPERFCAIYFQKYGCEDPNADSWSIPLPARPTQIKTKNNFQNDSETVQVLQITDVHIDPLYTPGSNSRCVEPLCCESGTPAKPEDAAGYWGDYNVCDMPWHTIEDMMNRIREKHKHIDWIYFTGDIVSHRTWATSVVGNTEVIKSLFTLMAKTFPNKTVFPILGNHETYPGDYYSPEYIYKNLNVSTQWVLDLANEEWSRWLPNATQNTIKKGGYYTVLVKPGFRIIALNSNVCFTSNFFYKIPNSEVSSVIPLKYYGQEIRWLVYENRDTFGQLQWLVDVLTEAERTGEKVHILSHIPSSDDVASCVKIWSREFNKIILRFSDTIVAQFNGHTHMDEFKLFFNSSALDEVKAVAYNGASFASYIGANPNYRIYEVNNNNMTVTDYSEYTFDLTKANTNSTSPPAWYKLYSFKEAYGLPDLTMKSLGKLYREMASNNSDNELVEQYFRYMYRDSDVHIQEGCDSNCRKSLVCFIGTTETSESIKNC